ncbi:MAG: hypothetical protein HY699_17140 [Deltaproteobacteria bacterium]|nr:hypothetical protein [Deltaproteobacteria bacterium]
MANQPKAAELIRDESLRHDADHHAPGTLVLALVFLLSFAVYFFANWKTLADVWHVR